MRTAISRLFLVAGTVCIISGFYLLWQRNTPKRLAFSQLPNQVISSKASIMPQTISFAATGLTLPIISLQPIDNRQWPVSAQGVVYAQNTPRPGESGNSILYGHNWSNLLGSLPKVKPGQRINIGFTDGSVQTFEVAYTSIVTPDQTHILENSTDRRLTIYTCIGLFDEKRFVVTAIAKS